MSKIRTYSELTKFHTYEDRFDYLRLHGDVGRSTFGWDRWVNQFFYSSREWKSIRDYVIVRDSSCDLGIPGFEIHHMLVVHHMNPMTMDDIKHGEEWITDPEFLITTSLVTHNIIHYGSSTPLRGLVERRIGDTKLW